MGSECQWGLTEPNPTEIIKDLTKKRVNAINV